MLNGTSYDFHYTFHFVHFVAGPVPDDVFLPPQGNVLLAADSSKDIYCRSEINIDLPPLPNDFSTTVEITFRERNFTAISREFYDYSNDR